MLILRPFIMGQGVFYMPLSKPYMGIVFVLMGLVAALPLHADDATETPRDTTNSIREINTQALLPNRLGPMEQVLWSDFPLTPDSREQEMRIRRTMLNVHQVGGYVTLASMLATCTIGQLIINGDTGLDGLKSASASATILLYFSTAMMSIFTPPPLVRHPGWSTTSTHKLLGIFHFSGMVLTPILGSMIEDKHSVQTLHQVSGYATTAIFGAALLVMTF
jgi:hypothetical protein